MALFRSEHDIAYVNKINQELIEKVIGEKITYYAISAQFSEINFYGESKEKVFDPPVEIYALIEWKEQDISTTEYGQDIIYKLKVSILDKHLEDINMRPYAGDMVEYSDVFFEIMTVAYPAQIFGKAQENIATVLECTSVRESNFRVAISGTIDQPDRTYPNEPMTASLGQFSYGNATFPFSASVK